MRPLRLDQGLAVPMDAEPGQIFLYAVDELGPAAPGVEIFDPQPEPIACLPADRRRISMTEVQSTGRRGREPGRRHRAVSPGCNIGQDCDMQI